MKINTKKKLILMRIKIFLIVLAAVFILYIFGANNLVIGIGAATTAATMFGEDYTANIVNNTIFNAILGVTIMYPNNTVFMLTGSRVLFTLIGAIVTAIIMNVFFPYKLKDDTKNTIIKYIDLNKSISNELEEDTIDNNKLEIMLLTNNYFWRRINYNNKELRCNDIESLLSEQINFITDVSFLFKTSSYLDNNIVFIKSIAKKFKSSINEEAFHEKAKQFFNSLSSDTERLILINMYKIYSDVKSINLLGEKVIAIMT